MMDGYWILLRLMILRGVTSLDKESVVTRQEGHIAQLYHWF